MPRTLDRRAKIELFQAEKIFAQDGIARRLLSGRGQRCLQSRLDADVAFFAGLASKEIDNDLATSRLGAWFDRRVRTLVHAKTKPKITFFSVFSARVVRRRHRNDCCSHRQHQSGPAGRRAICEKEIRPCINQNQSIRWQTSSHSSQARAQ
jgi:hypothetical protein